MEPDRSDCIGAVIKAVAQSLPEIVLNEKGHELYFWDFYLELDNGKYLKIGFSKNWYPLELVDAVSDMEEWPVPGYVQPPLVGDEIQGALIAYANKRIILVLASQRMLWVAHEEFGSMLEIDSITDYTQRRTSPESVPRDYWTEEAGPVSQWSGKTASD